MVMQKYFYTKRPSDGPVNQLGVNDILKEVQTGKLSLMHVLWVNSFQHFYAFQIPMIHDWMISHLSPYINSESSPQIPFSTFSAHEKHWYIFRKEKDNLFGPLSLAETLKMKKKDYIFETDFCFSFKEDSFFYAKELPEIQIYPKEKDQPFYFQRRSRRFNELHKCNVSITIKGQKMPADLIDFSENGAAIFCKLPMDVEDNIEITITPIDQVSDHLKSFTHKAVIKSVQRQQENNRYGLFLLDKAHSTLAHIKNEKKAA